MMFYNPHSYEDMKIQLQERIDERAALRPAEILTRDRLTLTRRAIGWLGANLVRLGTWIEELAQAGARDPQTA